MLHQMVLDAYILLIIFVLYCKDLFFNRYLRKQLYTYNRILDTNELCLHA